MFTDHNEIKLEMDNQEWKLKDLELSTLNALWCVQEILKIHRLK